MENIPLTFPSIALHNRVDSMENSKKFRPDPELRLMDQVQQVLRYHHYAYRTEQTYCDWIMRYIRYHGSKTHPRKMGKKEIEAFLSHLAVQQKVAASTQRQALNAIVFLYKKVLDIPVDEKLEPVRAKRHRRPPVVMAQSEVASVLGHMQGVHLLENGVNIRVVQELMGHADVKTTEIYTHVMEKDISVVQSPLDTI